MQPLGNSGWQVELILGDSYTGLDQLRFTHTCSETKPLTLFLDSGARLQLQLFLEAQQFNTLRGYPNNKTT